MENNSAQTQSFLDQIRDIIRSELNAVQSEILPLEAAAEFLHVKKSYLNQLTSAGVIAHTKPGGKMVYFLKKDLIDWLQKNRRMGSEERESNAATYDATRKFGK